MYFLYKLIWNHSYFIEKQKLPVFKLIKVSCIWYITWNPSCTQPAWGKLGLWPSPTKGFLILLLYEWSGVPSMSVPLQHPMQNGDNGTFLLNWHTAIRNSLKIMKFADKGSESAIKKIHSHLSDCINRNSHRAAKREAPRTWAPQNAMHAHTKASHCLKIWIAKPGLCPFREAEPALSRKDLYFMSCQKQRWTDFKRELSGFSILFPYLFFFWKSDQFWCPTLGSYLYFKCVFFFSFSICYGHYNKHEMRALTLTIYLITTSKKRQKKVHLILL